jgi:hypothetical protein
MVIARERAPRRLCLLALATAVVCGLAPLARADVGVEGTPQAVRVTTSQNTVADVLAALAPFNVKYRTAVPLDTAAQAIYSGSLGQVASRLLDGYNYVIKKNQETTEIVVFGRSGQAAAPPPEPPAKSVLKRWR